MMPEGGRDRILSVSPAFVNPATTVPHLPMVGEHADLPLSTPPEAQSISSLEIRIDELLGEITQKDHDLEAAAEIGLSLSASYNELKHKYEDAVRVMGLQAERLEEMETELCDLQSELQNRRAAEESLAAALSTANAAIGDARSNAEFNAKEAARHKGEQRAAESRLAGVEFERAQVEEELGREIERLRRVTVSATQENDRLRHKAGAALAVSVQLLSLDQASRESDIERAVLRERRAWVAEVQQQQQRLGLGARGAGQAGFESGLGWGSRTGGGDSISSEARRAARRRASSASSIASSPALIHAQYEIGTRTPAENDAGGNFGEATPVRYTPSLEVPGGGSAYLTPLTPIRHGQSSEVNHLETDGLRKDSANEVAGEGSKESKNINSSGGEAPPSSSSIGVAHGVNDSQGVDGGNSGNGGSSDGGSGRDCSGPAVLGRLVDMDEEEGESLDCVDWSTFRRRERLSRTVLWDRTEVAGTPGSVLAMAEGGLLRGALEDGDTTASYSLLPGEEHFFMLFATVKHALVRRGLPFNPTCSAALIFQRLVQDCVSFIEWPGAIEDELVAISSTAMGQVEEGQESEGETGGEQGHCDDSGDGSRERTGLRAALALSSVVDNRWFDPSNSATAERTSSCSVASSQRFQGRRPSWYTLRRCMD